VRVPTTQAYKTADWILFTGDNHGGGIGEDGEDGEDGGFTPVTPTTWTGCLTDRKMPYDIDDTNYKGLDPKGDPNKKYPALQNCLPGEGTIQTVYPLTGHAGFSALIGHVNGMTAPAYANTNLTIGVAWGHALLSKAVVPFQQARSATAEHHRRIIILVSGHANTLSRYYTGDHLTELNAQTTLACRSARNAGIEIFSVNVAGTGTNNTFLQSCAGTQNAPGAAGYFWYAPTNADIAIAFSTLAQQLIRAPRVTH
jgi:hypothetical protein